MVLVDQCSPKCGTRTTGGVQWGFKGYAAEKKLLKTVRWLALNKETKSFYQDGSASPS
jgi:hypothetical protein